MKKDSIFYALYYGAVAPWESSQLFQSKEYIEALNKANDLQEKLISQIGDENKTLLDEFLKADAQVGSFFEEEKFKDGFVLGARLMIETLSNNQLND